MTPPSRDIATGYLRRGEMSEALVAFRAICAANPGDWYAWYGAGQAARFLDDFVTASAYLTKAAALDPTRPSILLALGISLQLQGHLESAARTLVGAIDLDPDYAEAFNSLAITQKRLKQFDKALHNYDAGRKALSRRHVKRMRNDVRNPVIKLHDPVGTKWLECATFGALWSASEAGAAGISWPTGKAALAEEATEAHGGLYFVDQPTNGGFIRSFLPNFFGSFQRWLQMEPIFCNLVGNEGSVWELLSKPDLADQCFTEARAFGDPTRSSLSFTTD